MGMSNSNRDAAKAALSAADAQNTPEESSAKALIALAHAMLYIGDQLAEITEYGLDVKLTGTLSVEPGENEQFNIFRVHASVDKS